MYADVWAHSLKSVIKHQWRIPSEVGEGGAGSLLNQGVVQFNSNLCYSLLQSVRFLVITCSSSLS